MILNIKEVSTGTMKNARTNAFWSAVIIEVQEKYIDSTPC